MSNSLEEIFESTFLDDDHPSDAKEYLPTPSPPRAASLFANGILAPRSEAETKLANPAPPEMPPPLKQVSHVTHLPSELQVNILTYLRAYDLATVHQTCKFYHDPALVHAIVLHAAECVYPVELTQGFEDQPVMSSAAAEPEPPANKYGKKGGKKGKPTPVKAEDKASAAPAVTLYTFEHLRNMELLVVARVLSRPEPIHEDDQNGAGGGYYVSKSWCKTALLWLEWQQERQRELYQYHQAQQSGGNGKHGKKKHKALSKKQQRLRQRKYSDASPPWPNANSDLLCQHAQLQRCSNRKSARARRKILDKQAWKCLKKLYPETSLLETAHGECLQCLLEAETAKKTELQRQEELNQQRRAPLSQLELRRFYTRTRGVPLHCLKQQLQAGPNLISDDCCNDDDDQDQKPSAVIKTPLNDSDAADDRKPPSTPIIRRPRSSSISSAKNDTPGECPLLPGLYCVLPRAWCHAWRKYMKTGEGSGALLPPDASALLCDAHRLLLLPPHLESYLYGETPQLLLSKKQHEDQQQADAANAAMDESFSSIGSTPVARRSLVVGMSPAPVPEETLPLELGLSPLEVAQQQRALMTLEREQEQRERERELMDDSMQQQQPQRRTSAGEQLDRENYCCVEILTQEEIEALEKLWPRSSTFHLSFQVLEGQNVVFSTQPCRECDASGMANFCKIPKLKANLRAAHQAKVRIYSKGQQQKSGSGGDSKPGIQVEY
jgi:hypothetical protein